MRPNPSTPSTFWRPSPPGETSSPSNRLGPQRVWPGFGGQAFIPDVLEKVERLRDMLAPGQRLEIDGGIDNTTIATAVRSGADTLVAGSAVFGTNDPAGAIARLRKTARSASRAAGGSVGL